MEITPAPFFLEVDGRQLFVTRWQTGQTDAKPILLLPPFAEEMNRVRRFASELSKKLLTAGYTLWTVDLSCTGDSSGKFSASKVNEWQGDLLAALNYVQASENLSCDLLAIRGGSLFLPNLLEQSTTEIRKVCLVEPISTGGQLLNEFLRIRVAKSIFEGTKETVSSLATLLEDGDSLEVAGYKLTSGLYHELLELSLESNPFALATQGLVIGCMRTMNDARLKKLEHMVSEWQCPAQSFKTKALPVEPFWATETARTTEELDNLIIEYYVES